MKQCIYIVVREHFYILQKKRKKNSLNTHYIQFWMTSFPIKLLYFIYWEIIIIFIEYLLFWLIETQKNESFYLQWAYNSGRNNKVAHKCNFRPRLLYFGELAYDRPSFNCLCPVLETEHPLHLLSLLSSPYTNSDPGKQLNLQVLKMHFVQANPA